MLQLQMPQSVERVYPKFFLLGRCFFFDLTSQSTPWLQCGSRLLPISTPESCPFRSSIVLFGLMVDGRVLKIPAIVMETSYNAATIYHFDNSFKGIASRVAFITQFLLPQQCSTKTECCCYKYHMIVVFQSKPCWSVILDNSGSLLWSLSSDWAYTPNCNNTVINNGQKAINSAYEVNSWILMIFKAVIQQWHTSMVNMCQVHDKTCNFFLLLVY